MDPSEPTRRSGKPRDYTHDGRDMAVTMSLWIVEGGPVPTSGGEQPSEAFDIRLK